MSKPTKHVPLRPTVFNPIVAGPEAEAEFEELKKYKLTEDEPFDHQTLRLRKARKEAVERGWPMPSPKKRGRKKQ